MQKGWAIPAALDAFLLLGHAVNETIAKYGKKIQFIQNGKDMQQRMACTTFLGENELCN